MLLYIIAITSFFNWLEEGGEMENTESTYENIKVTADDLKMNFVDFMLDERGRELLGEYERCNIGE